MWSKPWVGWVFQSQFLFESESTKWSETNLGSLNNSNKNEGQWLTVGLSQSSWACYAVSPMKQ